MMATTGERRPGSDARRLVGLIAPHWPSLLAAGLLLAVATLLGLALPWVVRDLVDTVLVAGDLPRLDRIAMALVGLFLVQSLLSFLQSLLLAWVGQRLLAELRRAIHAQLTVLPLGFFTTRRTGELLSRVGNDVTVVQGAVTQLPISLLRQVIMLVGGLALMVVMSWSLTLVIVAILPVVIGVALLFGRRLQRLTTAVLDWLAAMMVALEEMLSGIRIVKSFTGEAREQARYGRQVEAVLATAMQQARLQAAFGPIVSFLGFAGLSLVLWFGGRQVVAGSLTPGELIAFLFYLVMVAGPMGELAGLYGRLREAMGAGRRLFELFDEPTEDDGRLAEGTDRLVEEDGREVEEAGRLAERDGRAAGVAGRSMAPAPPLRGGLRFAGVSFAYEPGRLVLDDLWLTVEPDEVVALVGPSGAGKSTLVNLIPRFYEPTAGRLELDGRAARDYDLRQLREQIGLVPQETFLFGGAVHENVAYGRPAASEAEIVAAARAANADDFIRELPQGYATVVGEKGIRLSMGQRQRIAIARVLLKNPRILILDEATSALDSESERAVQRALDHLRQGRTTVVIAHRLSTIRHADRIIVLDGGRISEVGDHAELLARGGLYHRLWSLQVAAGDAVPSGLSGPTR